MCQVKECKMNNTNNGCMSGLPSVKDLIANLNFLTALVFMTSILFCAITLLIYVKNIRGIVKSGHKEVKANVIALGSIYFIVSLSLLTTIIVPKSYFFCDSIAHISFVIISYQFYRLCINYIEGESKFIATSKEETFSFRAPPCCCCCPFLESSMITKQKFNILRFFVLQMAMIHVLIFIVLNIIYIEDPRHLENAMKYFVPFIALSILIGLWAFQITIRMIMPYYKDLKLLKKFLSFQLVLVFCKIQPVLLNLVLKHVITTCYSPFTIESTKRTIIQMVIQAEMILLSIWSYNLHKSA